jgi:hypothetical protein
VDVFVKAFLSSPCPLDIPLHIVEREFAWLKFYTPPLHLMERGLRGEDKKKSPRSHKGKIWEAGIQE